MCGRGGTEEKGGGVVAMSSLRRPMRSPMRALGRPSFHPPPSTRPFLGCVISTSSCLVSCYYALSCLVLSSRVCVILPCLVLCYLALSCLVLSSRALSYMVPSVLWCIFLPCLELSRLVSSQRVPSCIVLSATTVRAHDPTRRKTPDAAYRIAHHTRWKNPQDRAANDVVCT